VHKHFKQGRRNWHHNRPNKKTTNQNTSPNETNFGTFIIIYNIFPSNSVENEVEGMNIQTNRLLGILGAFLMVISFLPQVGGLFMLLGIILVLIALKGYADTYKDDSIFNNALYTIILKLLV